MEPKLDSPNFDADAKDLCLKLMEKEETKRLGVNGNKEIMAHPWFNEANWELIISDKMPPPFLPSRDVNALSQKDIGYFTLDKKFQETSLDEKDELYYKDWDWTNPVAYTTEVLEFLMYERWSGSPLVPMAPTDACCCVVS